MKRFVCALALVFPFLGTSLPVEAQDDLTQGHYRWRNDDGGESGGDTTEVSATGSTTTTGVGAYEALAGMSITPGAGDYLVWFSGTLWNSVAGTQHVSLFVDGSQVTHTEREITTEGSIPNSRFVTATHAYIPGVTAGQAINVQWQTDTGVATMLERTLTVTKVNAADVTQATATTLATETNTADTLINSMTVTPGAGDYLIWFSGSNANTVAPSKNHVSLYVNGSQVTHTEREIDQEESLGNTFFPVALHARVPAVGAGQPIEVRWRVDVGTANMNARTLTVYKINTADNFQASAVADDGPFSAGTYTQVNSMTLTPGAGDYLVWFSSSLVTNGTAGDTIEVSLFSGGSQVLASEREIWVDASIDTAPFQSYPVATHAYITGVGAADAIEVQWRVTGTGTATMHERTLVVQKVVSGTAATFAAAEDTKLTGLAKSTIQRVRFGVSNEGAASSGPVTYELQVAEAGTCNAGTYSTVPTAAGGHWQVIDSSFITDGEATSNISPGLTDEASTFVAGELKDTGNTTGSITLAAAEFTEIEFSVQALAAATDGGDYCFRLYDATNTQVLDTYNVYAEVRLAGPPAPDVTQGHYRWRNDDGGESGGDTTEVSATASTTTTVVGSYEALAGMSITPGAGDYLVWFSGTLWNSVAGTQHVSLFVDGSQVTHTEREITTEGSIPNSQFVTATHAYIPGVTAGQAINVQWQTDTGVATMLERTLTVTKVNAADVTQATATSLATETNTADTLINSMTVTPGAGDYLIWFSGSNANTVAPSKNHVSLYVNGSQVTHTEREIDQEESLGNTFFPVALHARVPAVGAGQPIEVRWRVDTGTANMNARTLTVYKINPADNFQASAVANDGPASPASYTQVNSMTLTPGAGDYLVWFSSSLVTDGTAGDTIDVSLFSGGSQVLASEREIWVDGSIDTAPFQSYPVATHAYITGVGAADAIEVQWRVTGTGTATMHERTLVVQKVVGGTAATFAAAEDTKLTGLAKSTIQRVRFGVSNEGTASSGPVTYELQVAEAATCVAGTYSTVPTAAGGHWQVIDSSFITDGEATSDISPGLTNEATTFVAGELKDTGNTTGSITLAADEFTEIEFSVQALAAATDGGDYCFRLYDATNTQVLDTYNVYAEVRLTGPPPDVTVSASGTQTASMAIPSTDEYVGGKFVIVDNTGSRNITGITITESGTVDALNDLDNIKLFYELDTTAPYDGASESYAGTESQFGVTDTTGFSAANGTSSFTDTVAINTTSILVVYVVLDVGAGASPGETVEISINDPSTEVTASAGTVGPATPVAISGTTTLSAGSGAIYYSVGTDNTALYSDTASAASGTLTLNSAAANNIGVGDEIREGANRYYITGRNSATEFTIQNSAANGGTPGDTNITFASTAITIFRAFNTLTAAEAGSTDTNHLNTADLVAGNFQLNWTCYNDAALDDTVLIDGYTTGASNYIHIYTPTATNEVGNSQRHNGTAGTGFRLVPNTSTPPAQVRIIDILDDDVRITGIEIDGSSITNAQNIDGIEVDVSVSASGVFHLNKIILHDLQSQDGTGGDADVNGLDIENGNLKLSNSIIYDLAQTTANANARTRGVDIAGGSNHYLHNNTLFNIKNSVNTRSAYGIRVTSGTVTVKNTVVLDVISDLGSEGCFNGTITQANNVSSDATAVGPQNQTAYATYFQNITDGGENLHLRNDSNTLWGSFGADLDSDPNLPVTEDIDGDARDASTPDIGADEFTGAVGAGVVFYSVGTDNTALYSDTASAASGTLTLNSAAANNIGVGDEIREGANRYYITGRTSATEFTIQNSAANGGTPGDTNINFASTPITIFRAFNDLDTATAGSADANHLNTSDLVAGDFQLNWAGYNDGPDPSFRPQIEEPWVTGATNYIRVFTPTDPSQVGVSQRHNGTSGTGYRIRPAGPAGVSYFNIIFVSTDNGYVRIEGIEIDGSGLADAENIRGIYVHDPAPGTAEDIRISDCLIYDLTNTILGDADASDIRAISLDETNNSKISNNIIYNILNVSANSGSLTVGIDGQFAGKTHYVYNNTVYNIQSTATIAKAWGIYDSAGSTMVARNNYVGLVDSTSGPEACFEGPFIAENNNVSSDATAAGAGSQTNQSAYASYFVDTTGGSENLHLLNDSNTLWGSPGADLDSDPNLPVTEDIDADARDASTPDIGADEFSNPVIVVGYSVGTDNTALYSDTASASSGTLTLNSAAADKIGVGDEIREGANRYYITGRNSATEFTIQNSAANGGTPGDTNISFASTAVTIFRAFNTLSAAEAGSLDGNHLGTADLVVSNFQLNWTCYDDAALDDTVTINGYTTGPNNFIHVYTPTDATEVGVSQRHDGTAGTGFRMAPIIDSPGGTVRILRVGDEHVRITGIELDGLSITNGQEIEGVSVANTLTTASDARFSKLIVHDIHSVDGGGGDADPIGVHIGGGNVRVSNSIIYDIVQTTAHVNADARGIRTTASANNLYLHNNTIFNIKNTGNTRSAWGIRRGAGTVTAKNNVVLDVDAPSGTDACFDGTMTQSNNVSSDATAVGPQNQTAYATYFQNITDGSEDLHLLTDSNTLWGSFGADLDSDPNLPITDDIDAGARDATQPDIGADEFGATPCNPTINYRSIGTNTANLADTGTASAGLGATIVTFSGVSLPTNIGQGDQLTLDIGGANEILYILSRDSATQVTLQTATANDHSGGVSYTIKRAFSGVDPIQDWETARQGDLVALNRREVGVAYNDGVFVNGVDISGSITDACHFMRLTVAEGQRHTGVAGTGVRIDTSGEPDPLVGELETFDDYVVIEWFEVTGVIGNVTFSGVRMGNFSANILLSNLILHGNENGARASGAGPHSFTIRNSIVYDNNEVGIEGDEAGDTFFVDNCTIYNNLFAGIDAVFSTMTVRNTISTNNPPGSDFKASAGTLNQSNNISSDGTASGAGSLINRTATDNGSPGGGDWVIFDSLTAGNRSFHLQNSVENDAIDAGTNLSFSFADDVDGEIRPAIWDVGADELFAGAASLTLADHDSSQVGDRFTNTSPVTDVLFRFKLTRSGTVTIDTVRVNFTTGAGVVNGDVSAGELWLDTDNDGVIDGGDILIEGSVTPSAGVLTFAGNFSPATSGTNYLVRATVANLAGGDTTTFSVTSADIDEVEGGVTESGSISNAVHTQDVGAVIYYSVGTDNTALYSDTASASTGVLTLNSAAANNIGVGDEIREGANRYYISGRNSATEFTIQNSAANGGTPGDTNITFASTAITIFRAFNTLTAAEAGSSDASHLNMLDLVAGDFQLNWTCYNDAALDDTVIIDGYTTGASNYIHIYTPTATNEVGVSQRHDGTAGTGFRLVPIIPAPPTILEIIDIRDDHVRITGIEFDGSSITNGRIITGIEVDASVAASGDLRFNKLIIHDLQSQDGSGPDADIEGLHADSGNTRISNSIIYDLEQTTGNNSGSAVGVRISGGSSHYLHNNTFLNIKNTGTGTGSTYGIRQSSGTVTVKNTVVLDLAGLGTVACLAGTLTQSNNVSSDATAVGPQNQTAYATYFIDITDGSEDLHLLNDSNALWGSFGADLDSDPNLPITDDIDGGARDAATPDIGADEFGAGGPCSPTINFRSIGIDTNPLANTGTASVALNDTVVTFSVALPTNIGRGDRIWLDTGGVNEERFILVRNSDTQVTLQQPAQNDHSGGVSYSIERAYSGATAIQDWETARQGDLVALNRREVGVAYNDGPFTMGATINGSTTDSCHYMMLTVAESQRHSGVAGTGAVLDGQDTDQGLRLSDDYTRVDWLEFTRNRGALSAASVVIQQASNVLIERVIIHDFLDLGNLVTGIRGASNSDYRVRNCIIYDGGRAGIRNNDASATGLVENCTVYGMVDGGTGTGILHSSGTLTVTNTLSVGNEVDFSGTITQSYNISSDGTAAGTGSLTVRTATDNPTPGAGDWVIFRSLTAGVENLHLQTGAENDAIDTGTDLSSVFSNDIDNELRPGGAWDIGADELADTLMVTGKYTGDGNLGRQITGLGFQPDVVLIKVDYLAVDPNDSGGIMKTATMSGANSKPLHAGQAFRTDLITSLDADGFTVGNTLRVNALNSCGAGSDPCEYHWIAWKAGADMKLGTYTGNGTTQSITGAGFSPEYLIVMAETNLRPVHRNSLTGAWSSRFGPGGVSTDAITSLDADGFSLGNSATEPANHPNESGVTYHYAVWNEVAGQMDVGIYPGDDSDNKNINGVGFQPEFVMVQAYDDSKDGRMKSDTMTIGASDDASMTFRAGLTNNAIQDLTSDGFQIGSHPNVNDATANFFYAAFNAMSNLATAVELVSFTATGLNGEVLLEWETGSEINNLGFNLYRSLTEEGPYEQITAQVIPGLGSSPEGAKYAYRDSGLTNGVTYYYQLEDIETTGVTELHGPVSATPTAEVVTGGGGEEGSSEGGSTGEDLGELTSRITYGDPSANELVVRRRGRRWMELELITEGFYAIPQEDGSVLLEVPGFEDFGGPDLPDVPAYRTWQDVLAGRNVKLASVKVGGVAEFASLRPSFSELIVLASGDGTVSTGRRRKRRRQPPHVYYPESWAQLMSVGFQGPAKKALVEMAPLRWDATAERLVLARRIVVRIAFKGKDRAELKLGKSHREVGSHANRSVYARIAVTEPGLYGVSYESVFGKRKKAIKTSSLRLSRQGEPVAFFVSPNAKKFKKKSVLYFLSDGSDLNPYGQEAVYELEASQQGLHMESLNGAPIGAPTSFYWKTVEREENLLYQAAFEGEEDIWQWDWLFGPMTNGYPFEVTNLSPVAENSKLRVWLHGASDFPEDPDHHVRLYVNGTLLTETWWDGETPHFVEAELGPGLLQEGENTLEIEEVGDTEAQYSMVMLDRFEVSYPAQLVAESGELTGSFGESGVATITGAAGQVFDLTESDPIRLAGVSAVPDGLSFRVESGRRYLLTDSVKSPEVRRAQATGLKKAWSRAEYLVIGPREFLAAAEPLLAHRRNEGLVAGAIATEDIYDEFGYGEATPESIRDFLSYVYHHWSEPTLHYVVLLGDGTYDTKDYLATGVTSQVPVKIVETRYMWTASDPWFGAINGDDILPDVAIGRLPAASVEEVQSLVAKILAHEAGEGAPSAPVVLVADDPDVAGNFDSDANEIASTILSGEVVEKIYLSQMGAAATRSAVMNAFDQGASVISYMGHGAIHLWANENLFNIWQVPSLSAQSQQPLLLTMNCLNGYFHFPYFNSLSEELLKAEGKGIIAAFSPTGLSLNNPAHRFHKALLDHVVNQPHERLGDAILAGQAAYAETGAFPELLRIYQLLGDPALRLR